MAILKGECGSADAGITVVRLLVGVLTGASISGTAWAGSFDQWGFQGEYKATISYAGAMRMENPDPDLINRPVDPLQPEVMPPGQIVGFTHTGLSESVNYDDGNRNFEKGDLVNNRLS